MIPRWLAVAVPAYFTALLAIDTQVRLPGELVHRGLIDEPRSGLGRYVVRHWERLSLVDGESLVYWLRKLVFRGAWLDHRVKEGLLDVDWDEVEAEFGYRDPRGDRSILELAPVPSWHELQFRR